MKEDSFGVIPLMRHEGEWRIFIILHKHGNHWGFPKGKANSGEAPLESARRELKEETGLEVEQVLCEQPIIETYTFYRNKAKVDKTVHYYPAIVSGAFILQPEEIRDGKWLSFQKAHQTLTFNEAKALCKKIEKLTQIQSRVYDRHEP